MLTYEKFSTAPVKVRTLYIKKLLNVLGYNLEETFSEDKSYKTALKEFQSNNGFSKNCVVSKEVFIVLINQISNHYSIWLETK